MIRINCTNCKAQLSIDDAFAGGVCRCQYCGTIQTVPKHLKSADAGSGVVATTATGGAPKTLYRNKARNGDGNGHLSSGLDAIAEAVATSSGLSGSGLANAQRRLRSSPGDVPAAPIASNNRTTMILVACAVAIVLLLGVIVGVLLRGNGGGSTVTPTPTPIANGGGGGGTVATVEPPKTTNVSVASAASFLGQPIPESPVVFVLDHGDATRDSLEYLKLAVLKSLHTLHKDQKFQIIFWKLDNQKDPILIPKEPALPTADAIAAAEAAMGNVFAFRTCEPAPALAKAFAVNPGVVIIASGKPVGDNFPKVVLDARGTSAAKVHCFSLNAPASRLPMLDVTKRAHGNYRNVTLEELQALQ